MSNTIFQTNNLITTHIDSLTKNSVDQQYTIQEKFWKPYQTPGYQKSLRDSKYHFMYLSEALAAEDISLFIDYVAWLKVLFSNLGFSPGTTKITLECMAQALDDLLPQENSAKAIEFIKSALDHLPEMNEELESILIPDSPFNELAKNYMDYLLVGDRYSASQMILKAVEQNISVKDIYMHVFQPVQQEIGRLWQMNQVSVAQEHFSTAATQLIMSQLYPKIFSSKKNGYRLVATSVSGELHEIGIRMVTDFLEIEGWDTYYLGANTPPNSVVKTIQEKQPDIIAISATIAFNMEKMVELISKIKESESKVKIMVGGYPFNISDNLWQRVGADGYARNALDAISTASQLVQN